MSTEQATLGQLIDSTKGRDAIHVAIAPTVAPCELYPGQRVDQTGNPNGTPVGIVDPFLTHRVMKGQMFYLCLFPLTVTSLRHEWTHPAFANQSAAAPVGASDPEGVHMRWMESFASRHSEPYKGDARCTADQLIQAGKVFLLNGDKMIQQGDESLRDETKPREFWEHFEAITGMQVPEYHRDETPFCCTC